jgi:co-chaperonin GroES (HSP10)
MSKIKGTLRLLRDKVMVSDMHFGEQRSSGGIVIMGDDGKDRGIYPRWGKVWAKGPENKEEYNVGDWILIEHGRWTRGVELDEDKAEPTIIRMVELKSVLMWSKEKPETGLMINKGIHVEQAVDAYRLENKQ